MRNFRMIGETPHATDSGAKMPAVERASPLGEVVHDIAPREHGGREGPEPTRYGDWEKNGHCIDF